MIRVFVGNKDCIEPDYFLVAVAGKYARVAQKLLASLFNDEAAVSELGDFHICMVSHEAFSPHKGPAPASIHKAGYAYFLYTLS